MKLRHVLLLAFLFLSIPARAHLITLESQWCCAGIPGTLSFTYDETTPDSFQDSHLDGPLAPNQVQRGTYFNAILSASFLVTSGLDKDKIFTFAPGSNSSINILRRFNANGTSTSIFMSLFDGSDQLDFLLNIEGVPPSTDSLTELSSTIRADFASIQIGTKLLSTVVSPGERIFNEVSNVPEPVGTWLFGSSFIGLIAFNRMRRQIASSKSSNPH